MAQREIERAKKSSSSNLISSEFALVGTKRSDELIKLQTELLHDLGEVNRRWFDRAQSEANLASELASKLTAARSFPEAIAACQEWTSRRFEMIAEDRKRLLVDTQNFMKTGARFLSNGGLIKTDGFTTYRH